MSAKECILEEIKTFPGQSGIYYQNLETGETWGYGEKDHYLAASIVKLPLMALFDDTVTIRENQKIPGCGAVQFLNGDVTLTVGELCKLMIVISDSCATNALFRHYGAAAIHDAFLELGLIGTQFNREYWDEEREKRGINNYFVPEDVRPHPGGRGVLRMAGKHSPSAADQPQTGRKTAHGLPHGP